MPLLLLFALGVVAFAATTSKSTQRFVTGATSGAPPPLWQPTRTLVRNFTYAFQSLVPPGVPASPVHLSAGLQVLGFRDVSVALLGNGFYKATGTWSRPSEAAPPGMFSLVVLTSGMTVGGGGHQGGGGGGGGGGGSHGGGRPPRAWGGGPDLGWGWGGGPDVDVNIYGDGTYVDAYGTPMLPMLPEITGSHGGGGGGGGHGGHHGGRGWGWGGGWWGGPWGYGYGSDVNVNVFQGGAPGYMPTNTLQPGAVYNFSGYWDGRSQPGDIAAQLVHEGWVNPVVRVPPQPAPQGWPDQSQTMWHAEAQWGGMVSTTASQVWRRTG